MVISLLHQQQYGLAIETITRKDYFNQLKNNLTQNLTVEETGLFISKEFFFLGASPDGLVHSTLLGRGLLEIINAHIIIRKA